METLGNQQQSFRVAYSDMGVPVKTDKPIYKVGDTRPPTLEEVMLDSEFLDELVGGNESLQKFLTLDKMLQLADYVIQEPKFSDSPQRCF